MVSAGILTQLPPGALDAPVRWSAPPMTVGSMIAEVADALDLPFVLAESANPAALADAPRFASESPSARAVLGVLEASARLEVWIHDGAMVWYDAGDRPALLGAAARRLLGATVASGGAFPPLVGSIDIEAATSAEAFAALAAAFNVPVAYASQLPVTQGRITLQAEDIDLATAVAIIAEGAQCQATWAGGAVLMDASQRASLPIDSGARAADIREARRLAQPSEGKQDTAGRSADRQS